MTDASTVGALAGWTIIDLTRVLGGPYCTQLLGDMGARIIKVEPPQGDETRDWGPPFKDGESAYFTGVNRNKESIGLDLSKLEGRNVLFRLLDGADVLIENFKTGTLEKWGLGYEETLRTKFPHLIHCRITGFGGDGPLGGFPGYDAVVQAMAGLISINGAPGSGPVRLGIPIVDIATGLYAATAILGAAVERGTSGKGQSVEASLFDTGIALLHPHAANWFMSGATPELTGNAHPNIAPYDAFPTKTGPVFLSIGNNGQYARLCEELDAPHLLSDPRFSDNADRMAHRDELRGELVGLLATRDGEALCASLLASAIPAGPILDMPRVLTHPHAKHRGMLVEQGGYRGTGLATKFSRTPGGARKNPPRFGEDGRGVLKDAGFTGDEVQAFIDSGVVTENRRRR
jgi:formyl-CoA transferase